MIGVTTFVIPNGIQMILFPWLVAVQLQESADRLGIAQMSTQLPGLFLILFGGVLADRIDRRKILIWLHLLAMLPALMLVLAIRFDQLSYPVLIVYALMMGTVVAFMQPARDGMLNQIAGDQLQRTVTVTMGLTFGAQIFGYIAASFADDVGAVPLLLTQAVIMGFGALAAAQLASKPLAVAHSGQSGFEQVKQGLQLAFGSSTIRPAMVLTTTMSLCYGGSFMVLNPVIVRDIYGGDASQISLSFGAFVVGTVAATALLVATGGLRRPGRGLMLALAIGGVSLVAASTELPWPGYLVALALWGAGGGVAMSMSRTIMQESAPDQYRARVMSIFSLSNLGGMPLGAFLLGYSAVLIGPLDSLLLAVGVVWLVVAIVWLSSNLANFGEETDLSAGTPP